MPSAAEQITVPKSVQDRGPHAIQHYMDMLGSGQSERMAEMLACRLPPGTKGTDSAFMQGRNNGEQLDGMDWWSRKQLISQAKAAGVDINGKVYVGSIADGRMGGDPDAWVSGSADVLRACKKKGLNCEGSVNYTAPPPPPSKPKKLSEQAISRLMKQYIKRDPSEKKDLKKLREKVIDKHTPSWKKKG